MPRFFCLSISFLAASAVTQVALAVEYRVVDSESVFTVLTHKGGLASGLAHNHIAFAQKSAATIDVDATALEKSKFRISIAAADLEIDDAAMQSRVGDSIAKYKIYKDKPFTKISDSDRASIKKNMFDASQLNVAKFPEIKADVSDISLKPGQFNGVAVTHQFEVDITLHGKTVRKQFVGTLEQKGGTDVVAEAIAESKFSEFGIEPYSAMLGAVKNQDKIHFYIQLKAVKK